MKSPDFPIKISAYFSASIRGEKGSSASKKVIHRNIEAGKKMATKISDYFGSMLNMYVPHRQDELIQILWYSGKITAWDVLDGDCQIVAQKDLLIVWASKGFVSTGMAREIKAAEKRGIPVVKFEEFNDSSAEVILKHLYQIMIRKMEAKATEKLTKDNLPKKSWEGEDNEKKS
jgi:hypothetical protein